MSKENRFLVYSKLLIKLLEKGSFLYKHEFESTTGVMWDRKNGCTELEELNLFFQEFSPIKNEELFNVQILCVLFSMEMLNS